MSKKFQFGKLTMQLMVAMLAALLVATAPVPVAAQRRRPAPQPAPAVNPRSAAISETTEEVLRETSEIRKLPVLRSVKSGAQTRAEIEQMLIKNLNENSTPEQMRASSLALRKFGLAPADFDLRSFIIKLYTEQVAGYYEPKTQQFYLADWISLDEQKPVMAHELTHALQDQHFNLRRLEKWPKHDSDAELAAHALVEGDATVVMMQYIMRSPLRQLAMFKSMVTGGSSATEQIEKAPRVLRETLLFPYTQGSFFASEIYKRGGWELVSKSYEYLPKSTEQILHPEKYFAREEPLAKIEWKNISGFLGKNWKMIDHDVNGEWGYYLILDQFIQSTDESRRAVAGWNGDRYVLYEGPTKDDVLIAQYTYWDTEQDAQEFFDAYTKRTTKRYGTEPSMLASGAREWKSKEGTVIVERTGQRVLIIEGIPGNLKAEELLRRL